MTRHIPLRTIPWFAFLIATFLSTAPAQAQDAELRLRLVCISALEEEQKIVIASRDEEGKWREHGKAELRSSFVSDWLPARAGELHLAVREEGALKSICMITCPEDARRLIVILIANPEDKSYQAHLVDPEKDGFTKNTILLFNLSPHTATVSLGTLEQKVEAGQHVVAKPALEESGMYRMMVSYLDANAQTVTCYDRHTSSNPNSRNMLFMLPDVVIGLKVLSLPMFD